MAILLRKKIQSKAQIMNEFWTAQGETRAARDEQEGGFGGEGWARSLGGALWSWQLGLRCDEPACVLVSNQLRGIEVRSSGGKGNNGMIEAN